MTAHASRALRPFGTTIFTTISRLAQQHGAVNLGQGFPDFDGPEFIRQAAARALMQQHNQYAPMPGDPTLRGLIARRFTRDTGLPCDPDTQVVVTAGCTEAIAASLLGLCNPGDEVVLFQPFYDSYRACVAMAGAVPRFVTLRPGAGDPAEGAFGFDADELDRAFTPRTRAVILNTPHNPTGKVFSQRELELIADRAARHDAVVIADEVYERLVFDPARRPHRSIAALPGMAQRTVTLSSLGKTFSLTGWKIGWAVAPPPLAAGVRAAHQFLTFAVATPLQHGAAEALRREDECVPPLVDALRSARDELADALTSLGFGVHPPDGTYFICADHSALSRRLGTRDDREFCTALIERFGVAAIPPSVFYDEPSLGAHLVRFAFCKRPQTLREGLRRLAALATI
jgi:N-succinyldiaminopimelate aminotransferase